MLHVEHTCGSVADYRCEIPDGGKACYRMEHLTLHVTMCVIVSPVMPVYLELQQLSSDTTPVSSEYQLARASIQTQGVWLCLCALCDV